MESLYIQGNMHDVFSTLALAHVILVPHFLELAPTLFGGSKGKPKRKPPFGGRPEKKHAHGPCVVSVARPLLCLLSCQGGVQDLQGRDPQVQFAQPLP